MKTYGGIGSEGFFSVAATPDSGFIATGTTGTVSSANGDMYIVRTDKNGDALWTRTYGTISLDEGRVVRALNPGFMLVGTSLSALSAYDMRLMILDDNGDVLMDRSYGGNDWEFALGAEPLVDGYIIAGQTYETGGGDAYVIRTDLLGNEIWSYTQGSSTGVDRATNVMSTSDGGFLICGSEGTASGVNNAFTTKLNATGGFEWSVVVPSDSNEVAMDLVESQNGDHILCGISELNEDFLQMLLFRVSATGTLLWTQHIGVTDDFVARSLVERDNGDIRVLGDNVAFGLGGSDLYFLLTDASGNFVSGSTYGGGLDEVGYELANTLDGGYIMAGASSSFGPGPRSGYLVKTDSLGQTATLDTDTIFDPLSVIDDVPVHSDFNLFPNPASASDLVTIDLPASDVSDVMAYDAVGRFSGFAVANGTIQFKGLEPGVYTVLITSRDGDLWRSSITIVE